MRSAIILSIALLTFGLQGCLNSHAGNGKEQLEASEFANKLNETPGAQLVDVRTPEEYAKGHLLNARNFDWNGNDFDQQEATLDKSKPVFVYCLSGARSAAAAAKMRTDGFGQVYELDGGIMKWRAANLPESNEEGSVSNGMSKEQFEAMLVPDKLVLVDFYADWCGPCKKMKPYLEEISKDMVDKVVVIRINADDNQALCKALNIDMLPVLQVYKNKTLSWSNKGFIDKESVLKQLK